MSKIFLFENKQENGASVWQPSKGQSLAIFVWGDFSSGTVYLELSPNGNEAFIEDDLIFTKKEMRKIYIPPSVLFRARLSEANTPNIHCVVMG